MSKVKKEQGLTVVELLVSIVIFSLMLLGAMAALVQVGRLYYKGLTTARTQEVTRNVMTELSQSIQFSSQDVVEIVTPGYAGSDSPEIAITEAALADDAADVTQAFCIGPRRYTFAKDRKLSFDPDDTTPVTDREEKEIRHVLWVDEPTGGCAQGVNQEPADLSRENPCDDSDPASFHDNCQNGRELISEGMRITRFNITQPSSAVYSIELFIAYGDDDLLEVNDNETPGVLTDDRYVCEGNTIGVEFCAISELSTSVLKRI